MEFLKEEPATAKKILFTGLDGAGKTSIILALRRELDKVAIIKPTKGVQRRVFDFLDRQISEWDLGGQKSYRISYLKNPSNYFDNTEIAIYVIDIQNSERFDESISYLNDVIDKFKDLEFEPPIYVFFHKNDPGLTKGSESQFATNALSLRTEIMEKVKYNKLHFHNTSIFNLSTIITSMSEILLEIFPKADLVEKMIKEFGSKFKAEAVEVIDDNSLIIGSYYENAAVRDILDASRPYFLNLNDSLELTGPVGIQVEDQMLIQRFGKNFVFKRFSLIERAPPYYLLLLKQDTSFDQDEFNGFVNFLKELIKK
jgi:DNA polymerase III delta prime subunit